jgi:RNA 2',3'-cyclic 3'-phosphodiesterase
VTALRAFFAVPLPAGAHDGVIAAQDALRRRAARLDVPVRWALPEQLHVTLVFLGDVEPAEVPRLVEAADRWARQTAPIATRLGSVGVFGPVTRATTLFVAVQDPSGALARLAGALADEAALLGVPREKRRYVPHVTLGRFRTPVDATKLLLAAPDVDLPAPLEQLRLYESRLTPGGGRYTLLHESKLDGAPAPSQH